MSIRIALDNQPEFYTNLDTIDGRIVLSLNRAEQVGGIIVKLEGESRTALATSPASFDEHLHPSQPRLPGVGPPGNLVGESHKILYKLQQVFPTYEDDVNQNTVGGSYVLQGGQHEFPFKFKLPVNNACSDQAAMSNMGGLGGLGGYGAGGGFFGLGGVRVMDGSKQLFLQHITKTLPPSYTGMPRAAEIRYYIKVTIQRPGLLKENWRYQTGFKFMPIEPPRQAKSGQEAYARRPFTFRARTASTPTLKPAGLEKKRSSFFGSIKEKTGVGASNGNNGNNTNGDSSTSSSVNGEVLPPSIEISARLPHPAILTCNTPIPLRIVAKKLVPSHEQVYLTSLQIDLVGVMTLRAHELRYRHPNRWTVVNQTGMTVPVLSDPTSEDLSVETVIPDDVWRYAALPNTVAPSFTTCNLQRTYELEVKMGLSWGLPSSRGLLGKGKEPPPQTIYLPLHFSKVHVYSGIAPPPGLVTSTGAPKPAPVPDSNQNRPPRLPPRTNTTPSSSSQQPAHDPLYPPQLSTASAPPYDEAPPSYDEAIADTSAGPFDGMRHRPAFSGVTNENAPSQMPEKS